MTDEIDADAPYVTLPPDSRADQTDIAFARIDLDQAWLQCGGHGERTPSFEPRLREVVGNYFPNRTPSRNLPAKQRDQIYQRLGKAASTIMDELNGLPDQIWYELQDSFTMNEPADVDDLLQDDNEGLTYGEYQTDLIRETLSTLVLTIQDARANHKRSTGRPKQNENLESVIRDLGDLFQSISGDAPMAAYRYNDLDPDLPYQGPFPEFLCATLWAFNGRKYPTNNALGEAARVAFGLRK